MHFNPRSNRKLAITAASLLLPVFVLNGCGGSSSSSDSDDSDDGVTTRSVSVPFVAEANGVAIDCDASLTGLGTEAGGTTATLGDFRFFVHDFRLVKYSGEEVALELADDGVWQNGTVALLDFQDKSGCGADVSETRKHVDISFEDDGSTYTALRFKVGVPAGQNHQEVASPPLNTLGMSWAWQAGRKYMRLDVIPDGGISRPTNPEFSGTSWNFHLGATGCVGDTEAEISCTNSNIPEIELSDFSVSNQTIVIDYGQLISGNNLSEDAALAPGCMSGTSDPECNETFTQLGLDLASGNVEGVQSIFSKR